MTKMPRSRENLIVRWALDGPCVAMALHLSYSMLIHGRMSVATTSVTGLGFWLGYFVDRRMDREVIRAGQPGPGRFEWFLIALAVLSAGSIALLAFDAAQLLRTAGIAIVGSLYLVWVHFYRFTALQKDLSCAGVFTFGAVGLAPVATSAEGLVAFALVGLMTWLNLALFSRFKDCASQAERTPEAGQWTTQGIFGLAAVIFVVAIAVGGQAKALVGAVEIACCVANTLMLLASREARQWSLSPPAAGNLFDACILAGLAAGIALSTLLATASG